MNRRIRFALATAGVALGAVTFVLTRPSGVLADLSRAQPERVLEPRISIPTRYRPCPAPGPDSLIPFNLCGSLRNEPRIVNRLAAARESTDPDSLQASALSRVIWWDHQPASQDAAIEQLRSALSLQSQSAALWVDLSAAYLVRAQRTQNPRDLVETLNSVLAALALDRSNDAALFNKALALEMLTLDGSALEAWNAYLRVDAESQWAGEARSRRKAVRARLRTLPAAPPDVSSTPQAVREFAKQHPQQARELGWNSVLGDWGAAVLARRDMDAGAWLALAERLGAALDHPDGDGTLADAVGAIRAAGNDPAATRTLAQAHRAYAIGQALFRRDDAAKDSFAVVMRLNPPSPVLVQWGSAAYAGSLVLAGKRVEAESIMRELLAAVDTVRHPALAARAHWILGTTLMKQGGDKHKEGRTRASAAARTYLRINEIQNYGETRAMEGEAAHILGDTLHAYQFMLEGLRAMQSGGGAYGRHRAVFTLADFALSDAMTQAAVQIQNEDVWIGDTSGRPEIRWEALMMRSEGHAVAGELAGADRDLRTAMLLADSLAGRSDVNELTNRLGYYRAVLAAKTDPGARTAVLDSAINYFADGSAAWLVQALLVRADARRAAGALDSAAADLDRAIGYVRGLSHQDYSADQQAAMLDQVRKRIDELVMLHLQHGDTLQALQALERGRVSFRRDGGASGSPAIAAPPGHIAVDYALAGNTLLIWTIRGTNVRLTLTSVDQDSLALAITRVGAELRARRDGRAEPHLQRLYDWLIRPVAERLGPVNTPLVIVADGEVARVPFAVLRDGQRREYLVERHATRVVSSLADAADSTEAPGGGGVLLVADPAFDLPAHLTLHRLRGAAREVDSLQRLYPDATVLENQFATREAVAKEAQRAGIIHYAGHAVFDDSRPERSFLVLAGDSAESRFTVAAVDSLDLSGVRLVVLSTCRTLPSRNGRSGGFAGLSGAFLSRGAGGVVGSLWNVNDGLAQPLMLAFHRAYQKDENAAEALRTAQREMMRQRQSPSTWAGFRYVGR